MVPILKQQKDHFEIVCNLFSQGIHSSMTFSKIHLVANVSFKIKCNFFVLFFKACNPYKLGTRRHTFRNRVKHI